MDGKKNFTLCQDLVNSVSIYVGNLDDDVNEDDLTTAFESFGELLSVKVVRDHVTHKSKNIGFIAFANRLEAETAIRLMHGVIIKNRHIKTNWATRNLNQRHVDELDFDEVFNATSVENYTVYVGGIPSNVTEEAIRRHFETYGSMVDMRILSDKNYAFVKFESHAAATNAICKTNGTELNGSCLKCWWGKDGPDGFIGGPSNFNTFNKDIAKMSFRSGKIKSYKASGNSNNSFENTGYDLTEPYHFDEHNTSYNMSTIKDKDGDKSDKNHDKSASNQIKIGNSNTKYGTFNSGYTNCNDIEQNKNEQSNDNVTTHPTSDDKSPTNEKKLSDNKNSIELRKRFSKNREIPNRMKPVLFQYPNQPIHHEEHEYYCCASNQSYPACFQQHVQVHLPLPEVILTQQYHGCADYPQFPPNYGYQ